MNGRTGRRVIAAPRERIGVVLVDDHELLRTGVSRVIDRAPDIELLGEAGTGNDGLETVRAERPDVVLLDVNLPDRDGISVCRAILSELPDTHIVMLTGMTDEATLLAAVNAGAVGFVLKTAPADSILDAVRRVVVGEPALPPELMGALLDRVRSGVDLNPFWEMTPAEMKILRLVAAGLTNREIARRLGVGEQTVKNHVSAVLTKLGVTSRTQATLFYLSHPYTDDDGDTS